MRTRGSVLVITIAILAGLVMILAGVAATYRSYAHAEANRLETAKARIAAESGVQRALGIFQAIVDGTATTTSSGTSTTTERPTTINDEWAEFGQNGDEKFVVGNSSFRIQIIDLSSYVNLNTAAEAQLQKLPLSTEQIDALLDFREPGQEARAEGGKDQFYNNLTEPYNAKLRPLDTFDELLQVKGFTPDDLYNIQTDVVNSSTTVAGAPEDQLPLCDLATVYSYSGDNNPQGEAKISITAGDQNTRLQRITQLGLPQQTAQTIANGTWTSVGQVLTSVQGLSPDLQQTLLDNLTTGTGTRVAGRINLNTASLSVLNTVPGITPDLAQAIVDHQSTGFNTLGEILTISGITPQILQQAGDVFSVNSTTFLVRVVGTAGSSSSPLEAVVSIQDDKTLKIVQIQRPPYTDYITRWNWNDQTTSETSLLEGQ
jgi:DNA uptake protein ComE-like DNA-binding protein